MLKCWEEDPSRRPTFTEIKTKFYHFLNSSSNHIQFPSCSNLAVEAESNIHATESNGITNISLNDLSGKSHDGYIMADEISRSLDSHTDSKFLTIATGMRRPVSEPILDPEYLRSIESNPDTGENDEFRMRSQTNPYVQTPKRASKSEIRKERFVWVSETPRIFIEPAN